MLARDDAKQSLLRIAHSRVTFHVSVFGGYLLLAIALTYPVAFHLTTHIPITNQIPGWVPGDGDPWHSLWVLWFTKHSLVELGHLPFSSDALFYPRGADLRDFGLVIFPLLVSLPLVQLIGLIAAYNLLILISLAAAGYATFLLVHYLMQDWRVAFVSGLIFAFCPYHLTRSLEHLFLVMSAVCLPLYVLFLIKALREGRTTNVLLASAVFLLTMLSNPYYLIFLLLFTGIYVLFHLRRSRHHDSRMVLIKRFALVAAFTVVLSLPIIAQALHTEWPDIVVSTSLAEVNKWSADLLAFFLPSPYHALWGDLVEPIYARFTGNIFEQTVYIGYVVLALALIAVVKAHQEETRFWTLCAIIFFVLALGPFLHINGKDLFSLGDATFYIPLPYMLFGFIPVLKGARAASRFDVMLMLSLAVLVGCGLRYVLDRFYRKQWGARSHAVFLGMIAAAILCEFVSVPLPILDGRVPKIYAEIGQDETRTGSLLDVPLGIDIAKYQYYQTAHRRKLLMGFSPRPSRALKEYANTFPLIKAFKEPDRILEGEWPWDRQDALQLIDLFDVDAIVLHREYLKPETADRLQEVLMSTFSIERRAEDGSLIVLWTARDRASQAHWDVADYHWDFDASDASPWLFDGWWPPEHVGEFTYAWADGRLSRLWVFFPQRQDFVLELGLFPLTFPECPPQGMKIYVNERFIGEIEVEAGVRRSYALRVPHSYLTVGVNVFRFIYRYAASPAQVLPGSTDPRTLAVAFDFIAFHPE
jgi:hypothetical protein